MTLRDLQQESLKILKDIHQFCIDNEIKYTLQGGTLLGAVRHKGFIPWDDDIDITMPRPDYERFIKTYHSQSGYTVFSRELEQYKSSVYIAYARVCDMKHTFVDDTLSFWTDHETGIWVDVFPLDGADATKEETRKRIIKLKKAWKTGVRKRVARRPFSKVKGMGKKGRLFIKKAISAGTSFSAIDKHIQLCQEIPFSQTGFYSNFAFLSYGIRERHRTEVLDKTILTPFEDAQFYIMSGYDEALKEKYGNYMKLPPLEKQVRAHSSNKYFWKES